MKQETHVRIISTRHGKRPIRINPGHHKKQPLKPQQTFQKKLIEESKPERKIELRPKEQTNEGKEMAKWNKLMIGALRLPVIAFEGQEGNYPETIKTNIPIYRMLQLHKNEKDFEENATDQEVLGYLSTMSLAGPLRTPAKDLMGHLMGQKKELGYEAKELYEKLRKHIRKTQWEQFNKR